MQRTAILTILAMMTAGLAHAAAIGDKAHPIEVRQWVKNEPTSTAFGETVYVVEFWATWCAPCLKSIPHLTELQRKYAGKGVVVIGISDEDAATVEPFVEKMGDEMDYTVAIDKPAEAGGEVMSNAYMRAYGQEGIPTAFIVDRAGRIAWVGHPMMGLDQALAKVIAGDWDPAEAQAAYELEQKVQEDRQAFMQALFTRDSETVKAMANRFLKDYAGHEEMLFSTAGILVQQDMVEDVDPELILKLAETAVKASDGESAPSLFVQGMALANANRKDEARAAYQKALEKEDDPELQEIVRAEISKLDEDAADPENASANASGEQSKQEPAADEPAQD